MTRQFQFVHGSFNFDLQTIISHGLISLLVSGITNKSQQVLRVSFKDGENYREGNWADWAGTLGYYRDKEFIPFWFLKWRITVTTL